VESFVLHPLREVPIRQLLARARAECREPVRIPFEAPDLRSGVDLVRNDCGKIVPRSDAAGDEEEEGAERSGSKEPQSVPPRGAAGAL